MPVSIDHLIFGVPPQRYYSRNALSSLPKALSMSQNQTRKQKIMEDVKRKRKQRALTTLIIVIALIAIIVIAVFFLPKPPSNPVLLPLYLSNCVTVSFSYHSHPNLSITINGVAVTLPTTFDQSCPQPIHTHDSTGVLHLEPGDDRDYHLSDWFLLWGHFASDPNLTIFNSTQIFTNKVDATHHLTMTVNGVNETSFGTHLFPRNAAPTGGTGGIGLCSVAQGQPCVKDNIVITYG